MLLGASRPTWLLWAGATAGLVLSVSTVITPGARAVRRALPEGIVAKVNGRPVARARYHEELRRLGAASAGGEDAPQALREQALRWIIDEELLLQHGEELSLHRHDPRIRQALLTATLAVEREAAEHHRPSAADLEIFYDEVAPDFERPPYLHMRQVLVLSASPDDDPRARAVAQRAASMLRSEMDFDHVCRVAECPKDSALPDELTPAPLLETRVGAEAVAAALSLGEGGTSAVLSDGRSHRVLQVLAVQPAQIPPLADVRTQVITRYLYRQRDAAFAEKLAALRETAQIVTAAPP